MTDEIKTYYITDTIYDPIAKVQAKKISESSIQLEDFPVYYPPVNKPSWYETKAEAILYLHALRGEKIKELKDQIFKLDLEVKKLINLKLGDVNNDIR